ncbi:type IV pilus modification protein PilV [Chromobacterium subtsugae]|uniref:type IV pilus modification protein PilV n=1 Tax=Chromobacterium subtsugae TaxID=251747 RepID=UPI0009B9DF8E|nr:type IV pilus modification protein PilV [Chromobacterium subtsugae]
MRGWRAAMGFTMLEVLIALLVLAMGVLAAIAVMLNAERASGSGYLRQMANQYAYDMVDRMRANSAQVAAGAYDVASGVSASTFQSNCVATVCTAATMATFDKYQWLTDLQNNLPNGTGSIYQPASGATTERVVQVWWTDGNAASGGAVLTEIVRTIM